MLAYAYGGWTLVVIGLKCNGVDIHIIVDHTSGVMSTVLVFCR